MLIRGCLSSTSFIVIVNSYAKGWVKAFRVLSQVGPLYPSLFTITIDMLSRMVVRSIGLQFSGRVCDREEADMGVLSPIWMILFFSLKQIVRSC